MILRCIRKFALATVTRSSRASHRHAWRWNIATQAVLCRTVRMCCMYELENVLERGELTAGLHTRICANCVP
jgi:hypothetical protein